MEQHLPEILGVIVPLCIPFLCLYIAVFLANRPPRK